MVQEFWDARHLFSKGFYDDDVLSEDGIFAWANQRAKEIKNDPDADQRFFMKVKPFVQWLQEASKTRSQTRSR